MDKIYGISKVLPERKEVTPPVMDFSLMGGPGGPGGPEGPGAMPFGAGDRLQQASSPLLQMPKRHFIYAMARSMTNCRAVNTCMPATFPAGDWSMVRS